MLSSFVLYLGIGRLVIYIVQKFVSDATKIDLLNKWAGCDLCSGVWIYTALAFLLDVKILSDIFPYIPIASEFITGCVSSFMMHLLVLGWKEKFLVIVI